MQKGLSLSWIYILVGICIFLILLVAIFFYPKTCGEGGMGWSKDCKCFGSEKRLATFDYEETKCYGICYSCLCNTGLGGETKKC